MKPEERNANIIGWTLIALALIWIAPSVPLMIDVSSKAAQQFWRDFQKSHNGQLLQEDRQPFPPKDRH